VAYSISLQLNQTEDRLTVNKPVQISSTQRNLQIQCTAKTTYHFITFSQQLLLHATENIQDAAICHAETTLQLFRNCNVTTIGYHMQHNLLNKSTAPSDADNGGILLLIEDQTFITH
jgi:hypothetical protein